jgi:hypothetical protein
MGGIVSLNITGNGTTTISTVALLTPGTLFDAIVVSTSKVLIVNNQASNNVNLLIDTAGTASAGTALSIAAFSNPFMAILYQTGSRVFIGFTANTTAQISIAEVETSGTAVTLLSTLSLATGANNLPVPLISSPSNSVLRKSPLCVYSTSFWQNLYCLAVASAAVAQRVRLKPPAFYISLGPSVEESTTWATSTMFYRGKADSERWFADGSKVITKLECVQ